MTPMVSLLLLTSLSMMIGGLALLVGAARDELRELSPAELSTSRPVPRSCRARVQELWATRMRPQRAPRRVPSRPRAAVLELAEVSAARTLLAGRIDEL